MHKQNQSIDSIRFKNKFTKILYIDKFMKLSMKNHP